MPTKKNLDCNPPEGATEDDKHEFLWTSANARLHNPPDVKCQKPRTGEDEAVFTMALDDDCYPTTERKYVEETHEELLCIKKSEGNRSFAFNALSIAVKKMWSPIATFRVIGWTLDRFRQICSCIMDILGQLKQYEPSSAMENRRTSVTFEVNVNGTLKVQAEDQETLTVPNHDDRLTRDDIKLMAQDIQLYTDSDKKLMENLQARNELEAYAIHLKHRLQNKNVLESRTDEYKKTTELAVDDLIKWLGSNRDADSSDFRKQMKNLEDRIQTTRNLCKESEPECEGYTQKVMKTALPVHNHKEHILEAIKNNQMIIVIGDTGSGKTTQIPQFIMKAGLHGKRIIGVTQPRKVAVKSVASRVAVECGVPLGGKVGYAVRFENKTSQETQIKFLTDGLLVRECATDPSLERYSVIIVDEAHERNLSTDMCFGLLKLAALNRPDLKIIICSATLDEKKFSRYFNNAPIFKVRGNMHPVEVVYSPQEGQSYLSGVVSTIIRINASEDRGDVLVFLSGQDEINQVAKMVTEQQLEQQDSSGCQLLITPCCGSMTFEEQQKIFQPTPPHHRKVILATNIAETSVTVGGVKYVIDSGFFKQNEYNPNTGITSLVLKPITKFQALQRSGRAGRTCPGKCFRMYSKYNFSNVMENAPVPEILRCNLESLVLQITAMGISNPHEFPFMDSPPHNAICEAVSHLQELSALDSNARLTYLGKQMLQIPLVPHLAKVLLVSEKLACQREVLTIVAMLSIRYQYLFKKETPDEIIKKFQVEDNDLLNLYNIYNLWVKNRYSKEWCVKNGLNMCNLFEAKKVRQQVYDILLRVENHDASHNDSKFAPHYLSALEKENIAKAFTSGFFRHIARRANGGLSYLMIVGEGKECKDVFLHPSSSLFDAKPLLVMYHDVFQTSKNYIRGVIKVKVDWVREYAPKFAELLDDEKEDTVKPTDDEDVAECWDDW